MSRRARWGAALVVSALAGSALTGCGDQPGFDAAAVESHLMRQAEGLGEGAEVGSASCPDDVRLREGVTFRCTLEVSGSAVPYRVRLTGVRHDPVTVRAHPEGVLVDVSELRRYVDSGLPKTAEGFTLDCGAGRYVVADPGEPFECDLVLGSVDRKVRFEADATGRVTLTR